MPYHPVLYTTATCRNDETEIYEYSQAKAQPKMCPGRLIPFFDLRKIGKKVSDSVVLT